MLVIYDLVLATTRYDFMLWSFDVAIDEGVYLVILSLVTKLAVKCDQGGSTPPGANCFSLKNFLD